MPGVHVVPAQNGAFHQGVTPPMLVGETVSDAWRSSLREPDRYLGTTLADVMKPILLGDPAGGRPKLSFAFRREVAIIRPTNATRGPRHVRHA